MCEYIFVHMLSLAQWVYLFFCLFQEKAGCMLVTLSTSVELAIGWANGPPQPWPSTLVWTQKKNSSKKKKKLLLARKLTKMKKIK